MRRGIIVTLLGLACALAQAAPQRGLPPLETIFEVDHLHSIADWLRANGRDGYIGADVADAGSFEPPDEQDPPESADERELDEYESGTDAIDEEDWAQAVRHFERVATMAGSDPRRMRPC